MNMMASPALEAALPAFGLTALLVAVLPWCRRDSTLARSALASVALLLTARYVWWRWTRTLPPVALDADFIVGLAFFCVEALTIVGVAITYVILTRTRDRSREADGNIGWLRAQPRAAIVDVFICTYNEDREILERTILGALAMEYLAHRVWVLDDGRRAWLAEVCAELGCGYLTRSDNAHAKAGNINNALAYVARLPDPPDYISILDADFVPAPDFLTRTLCLFRDPDVGLVQTPQHFINPDPLQSNLGAVDVWPDEQRFFFDVVMPSKDAWGVTFCCGTSSVIRFDALSRIGGFPTSSVTENYLVTLKLQEIGLETIYLNERLSLGLAPEGLREYITQRSRWCLGLVQICRGSNSPFNPARRMAPLHRLCLIEAFLFWAAGHTFRLFCIAIPILYLLLGVRSVQADLAEAISHFLPYLVAQVAFVAWIAQCRVLPVMTDVSQLLSAPEIVKSVMAGLWNPKGHGFKVTAKGGDRSKTVVQWTLLRFYLVCLALTIIGVLWAFVFDSGRYLEGSSALSLFWSWYNIVVLIIACFVCVELPRPSDDLVAGQVVNLSAGGSTYSYVVAKSAGPELYLAGVPPGCLDGLAILQVGGEDIPVKLTPQTAQLFRASFDTTSCARSHVLRHFYQQRFRNSAVDIRTPHLARTIAGHLFR